jgi:hypothetical protein
VTSTAAHLDLLGACRVLFGAGVQVDQGFLARLDVATVRRLFRKRAIEIHPDRAAILHRHPAALAELFKQVEAAYRTLRAHLEAGEAAQRLPPARPTPARPAAPARPVPSWPPGADAAVADHHWTGPIPSRTLRLGEFLYYSRRISWLELIRALVWQGRQRPRFGQVATRLGYLTPERLASVLSHRRGQEKIGEAALRLRFISSLQQQVVLQAQQRGCRRIGDYFVQSGLVAAPELDELGRSVRAHNARVASARAAA